jgi:hypothetical protein
LLQSQLQVLFASSVNGIDRFDFRVFRSHYPDYKARLGKPNKKAAAQRNRRRISLWVGRESRPRDPLNEMRWGVERFNGARGRAPSPGQEY